MRTALALLLALLVLPLLAARAEEPVRIDLEPEQIPADRTDWFGMYVQGAKAGWLRVSYGRTTEGILVEQQFQLRLASMGQKVEMDMVDRSVYAGQPPYALLSGDTKMSGAAGALAVRYAVVDGKLKATIGEGADARAIEQPAPDSVLSDVLTQELWFTTPRKVGDRLIVRHFDTSELREDLYTLVVTDVRKTTAAGVATTVYSSEISSGRTGPMGTMRVTGEGRAVSLFMGGMFEARLEPEAMAKEPGSTGDLFVFGMAKVDRPIGDATKVKELTLAITGDGAAQIKAHSRQAVEPGEGGGIRLRIGTGQGTPLAAGPEEAAENLKETVGYPIHHESVKALARQAIGDATEPRQKVERLVRFVGDFVKDALRPELVDIPRLIREPRGDCSEHAILFVALARAAGVPAREVGGLMYMGDEVKAFGWHAWAEVVLDGRWVEVDPTWNQMEPDATHILVGAGEEAEAKTVWALGRLQIRVLDAK